jgi:hypothetical protein
VDARVAPRNSSVEIAVTDTGMGIRPEFLPHVFETFRQADSSSSRKHGGLGLGLAIVKQLVELHGGRVSAESEGEGHGTTVTVRLPLMPLSVDPAAPPREGERPLPEAVRGLGARGGRPRGRPRAGGVRAAAGGGQGHGRRRCRRGSRHAAGAPPRRPPLRPGDARRERLRADEEGAGAARGRGRPHPAIALTAYARDEDRVRTLLAGFQRHLAKPVRPDELAAAVAALAGATRSPM